MTRTAPAPGGDEVHALLARVKEWIADDPEPGTARYLQLLMYQAEDGDPGEVAEAVAELTELFSSSLTFGTAGVRGTVGPGPSRMNRRLVRQLAGGVAGWVRASSDRVSGGVVVGRDARHRSYDFVADIVEILAGAGLVVHALPGVVPTPVLAFSVRHLGAAAGIMVTASHNPASDNGCKVYDSEGRQVDATQAEAIEAAMAAAGRVTDLPASGAGDPLIRELGLEVEDAYIAALLESILRSRLDRATVEVAYTALHGVGGSTVRRLCSQVGFVHLHEVSEQSEADPDFPTVAFPNPEEPGALDLLLSQAAWAGADVALAHDPDADRLAMAVPDPALGRRRDTSSWRVLTGDELGWLLADHLLRRGGLPESGVMATTIVSSSLLAKLAAEAGIDYVATLTGFKWIVRTATPMRPLIFGYEEALGYCVGEAVRDKDGIGALLLAAEMVSDLVADGLTPLDRLDDLARRFGVHATGQWSLRLEGAEGASRIDEAMTRLRSDPPPLIGGRRIAGVLDLAPGSPERDLPPADVVGLALPGARVVVRPSGTEPKLKCYAEVVEPVADGADLAECRSRAQSGLDQILTALPAALGLS